MHSVPIFTNITSGSAVSGNRLDFGIFGEPGSSLEIVRVDTEEETLLVDASTNSALIDTNDEAGVFNFDPGILDYGSYTFKVEDTATHQSSTVTVSLYKSLARTGLFFTSGGDSEQSNDQIRLRSLGSTVYRSPSVEKDNTGNGFLDVIEGMY